MDSLYYIWALHWISSSAFYKINNTFIFHKAPSSHDSPWTGHNSHLCPILIIPNSYSRGVIKSIVVGPSLHACPSHSFSPWLVRFHPLYQCISTLLFYPPSCASHFNSLSQNVHLPLLSNLLYYHLKCHSLPTTPLGSSLIQPHSPLSSSPPPTFTLSIQHPVPRPLQTLPPASVSPSAATLHGGSCRVCLPHMRGLLTLAVKLGRYDD